MNFLLADYTHKLTFIFSVLMGIIIPVAGLMISIAENQKPRGASRCNTALILFFACWLLGGFTVLMQINSAIYEAVSMVMFLVFAIGHALAAIVAMMGIAASRRRRMKWHATRMREGWSFWLNIFAIVAYGVYFLAQAFPKIFEIKNV